MKPRTWTGGALAVLTALVAGCAPAPLAPSAAVDAGAVLRRVEQERGVRIGVVAIDTGTQRVVAHRPDERFTHASTFKAVLCAVVLDATSPIELDRVVRFTTADLVANSPVAETRVTEGMSLRELCDATIRYSDNTAANLLLQEFGGPQAVDAALARLGDDVTSLDRYEPALSDGVPGDLRDTSTPRALAEDLRRFVVDDGLAVDDRALLTGWLDRNTTGAATIRAGTPPGWVVGDKTGTGGYGVRNDIGVLRPPGRAPIVLAVLTSGDERNDEPDSALVAEATRIALAALGR